MDPLTIRNKDFCTYTGVFGVMFSFTCLVQHFMYTYPHWITAAFAFVYIYSIISFSLLTAQRHPAPVMLVIDSVLLLAAVTLLIKSGIISVVLVLTFIYTGVIVVITYMDGLPAKFKHKLVVMRTEKELWKDKL